jgi:hypothetical protein
MVSSYAMFVKEHIHKFKDLPAKQRMKAVAELYHKQKSGMSEAPSKRGRGRPKKGGSFLGDMVPFGIGNMLGLGLEDKKGGEMTAGKLVRKKKGGAMTAGSLLGSISPIADLLGLGLEDKKGGAMTAAGLHKKRGRPSKKGGAMTAGVLPNAHSVGPLHAGSFADMFFKGLTAPFAVASKIPIPVLQQIGQAGTQAFNAVGAPTFFS